MIGGRVARCYCDWPRLNKDTLGRARQYSAKTSTLRTKTHSCRAIATMVEVLPVPGGPFEFDIEIHNPSIILGVSKYINIAMC